MPGPRLDPKILSQWARVRGLLRAEVGDALYKSWLKPLTLVAFDKGIAHISVPTQFLRDWICSHYRERLRQLWIKENPALDSLEIFVQKPTTRSITNPFALSNRSMAQGADQLPKAFIKKEKNADISGPIDPRFTFANFVKGKSNELAYAAARRVADSGKTPFNPLFLYGGVGLGKTHLMHSIAHHTRAKFPDRKVVYLSAEKFMFHFIRALRSKDTVAFKENFRSVDLLMIDDVQFINGKEATQEEFFHTFNELIDNNHQVVISADKSPSDLEGMEERLRSRLGCGLVADIQATNFELRLGVLEAKSEKLSVEIPPKVKEFLSHRITSNIRELEGALNRVVAHSELVGREITLETCQDVLHDILRANDHRVTIEDIQKRVSEHFSIRLTDMHSARRARAVARPRQIAMYLAKQLTSRSLPEIGRKFGGRDHTTVMHAVKKIEELRQMDLSFSEDVDLLRRLLEG